MHPTLMNAEQRDELVELAAEIILDAVRNEPRLPFHRESLSQRFSSKWFSGVADEEGVSGREQAAIARDAVKRLAQRCPSLFVSLGSGEEGLSGASLKHQPDREWLDVLREIYGPAEADPARVLSYSASELFSRVKSGELADHFVPELSLKHRLRCFGWNGFNDVVQELELKRGLKLRTETKDETTGERRRRLVKFVVVAETDSPPPLCPAAPNPVFRYQGPAAGVHHAFLRFVQQQLLELKPRGTEPLVLWAFDSLREWWRCQPDCREKGSYQVQLAGLLEGCVVHPDVKLRVNFGHHAYAWTVHCESKRPWDEVLTEIERRLAERDVGEQYALGVEAASLLRWIRNQPTDKFLLGCTPVVEDAIRSRELRLGAEWPRENLPALVEVLCDEVTRKTPFTLKRVGWKSYSEEQSRIHVSQNVPTDMMVIAQVQVWLGAQGIARQQTEIAEALNRLRQG
jgi:hypothetical protein